MILSFPVEITYGNKPVNAVVTPFPMDDLIFYDVHTNDSVFTIKPVETKTNGVLWVNAKNERGEIYQLIGQEIEKRTSRG